jgi:hypothetical protein
MMRKSEIIANHGTLAEYAKAMGKPVAKAIQETKENGLKFVAIFAPGKDNAEILCFSQRLAEEVSVGDTLTKEQANSYQVIELEYENGDKRLKIASPAGDTGFSELF